MNAGDCEFWKMYGRHYFVRHTLDLSSHYSDIKMKALSQRWFVEAFHNKSGDFAFRFEGSSTRLTIPLRDIINESKTVMLFSYPFLQGRSFVELFCKMKVQHRILR